ncbi:MAG TPA: 2-phosphosulfolactate phosphatase [Candidatus Dormibacteraeota bacterium]|nr:2-phosphosulfolactate phosphatase [Candidatus Dormibacteraeota bacterium]
MRPSFVIDATPEAARLYRETHAIVAVDVFRATTVIVTALACGHPIYPVASVEEAETVAGNLHDPLLAGEQAGIKPDGFHLNNSPAAIEKLTNCRPIVLVTSAGTKLLSEARGASSIYVASLRNIIATAAQLVGSHRRVALIGAGTHGKPRPEDQFACARIAELLCGQGYMPENERTVAELARWHGVPVRAMRDSPSVDFLRESNQLDDVDFTLSHVDDVDASAVFNGQQVSLVLPGAVRLLAEA